MVLQHLLPHSMVQRPIIIGQLDLAITTKRKRSSSIRNRYMLKLALRRAKAFMREAPTFQLKEFKLSDAIRDRNKDKTIHKLQKICDNQLGPGTPEQCLSAKFIDAEGTPIFYYFGYRIAGDNIDKVSILFLLLHILLILN